MIYSFRSSFYPKTRQKFFESYVVVVTVAVVAGVVVIYVSTVSVLVVASNQK